MNYSAFFELSPELLCAIDREGRFVDVNPAWERALGYPRAELRGQPVTSVVEASERDLAGAALARMHNAAADARPSGALSERVAERGFHARFIHKNGSIRWLSWSGAARGDLGVVLAAARDVTTSRADASHLLTPMSATPDFVAITTLSGEVLYINPAGLALIGHGEKDARSLRREDLIPSKLRPQAEAIRDATLRDGVWTGESVLAGSNGEMIPVSMMAALIRDEEGKPEAIGTIARDARARKRDELRARQLRTLMSSTSDLIAIINLGGEVTYMNPAGLTMLGRRVHGAPTLRLTDILHEEGPRRFAGSIRPTVLRDGIWAGEMTLTTERGGTIPVSMVVLLIRDDAGEPESIGVIARDRTSHKELEAALQQSIRSMSTPMIQIWEGVLALPVIGVIDTTRAALMMESLLEAIVRTRCKAAIIELTGAQAVDASTVRHILEMIRAASLLGSECLISGISPEVAKLMASLDVDLTSLRAFSALHKALRYAMNVAERG